MTAIRLTWSTSQAEAIVRKPRLVAEFADLSTGDAQHRRKGRRMLDTWASLAERDGYAASAYASQDKAQAND
jgi:hypothetical protein